MGKTRLKPGQFFRGNKQAELGGVDSKGTVISRMNIIPVILSSWPHCELKASLATPGWIECFQKISLMTSGLLGDFHNEKIRLKPETTKFEKIFLKWFSTIFVILR